jgi:hypothetical protein
MAAIKRTRANEGHGPDLSGFGRQRAVIHCHCRSPWTIVGQVRGGSIFGTVGPYDLFTTTNDVAVACDHCGGRWTLDVPAIRLAVSAAHRGRIPLPVDKYARPVAHGVSR